MRYLCPKCKSFMVTISTYSIPEYTYYKCLHCGYESKLIKEQPLYITLPIHMTLPKELWSDEDSSNECSN